MTAASVVSLPVPAVVGMAMRRGKLFVDLQDSLHLSKRLVWLGNAAAVAFAQSILEPPPKR